LNTSELLKIAEVIFTLIVL